MVTVVLLGVDGWMGALLGVWMKTAPSLSMVSPPHPPTRNAGCCITHLEACLRLPRRWMLTIFQPPETSNCVGEWCLPCRRLPDIAQPSADDTQDPCNSSARGFQNFPGGLLMVAIITRRGPRYTQSLQCARTMATAPSLGAKSSALREFGKYVKPRDIMLFSVACKARHC